MQDLGKLEFIKGGTDDKFKYKVTIPAKIWNKWRSDKIVDKKTIKFGAQGYQQYYDKIGDWRELDHGDEDRCNRYKKRHEAIEIKINGKISKSYKVPFTSEFFSYYLLW